MRLSPNAGWAVWPYRGLGRTNRLCHWPVGKSLINGHSEIARWWCGKLLLSLLWQRLTSLVLPNKLTSTRGSGLLLIRADVITLLSLQKRRSSIVAGIRRAGLTFSNITRQVRRVHALPNRR